MINVSNSKMSHNLNYKLNLLNTSNTSNYTSNYTSNNTRHVIYDKNNILNNSNTNYIAKRDFLFRFIDSNIRNQIIMDDESLYSTTDQLTADRISKDILKFLPSTSTITDATACIGGTAYSFSQHFQTVHAIEIDHTRFNLLVHNLKILAKESTNIAYYNDDFIHICKKIKQNAIFIDPPWGGPDYKKIQKLSLYISNIELSEICKDIFNYTEYIVIKVPTNFDEEKFINNTKGIIQLVHKNTALRKMYLLVFKCNTII